MTSMPSQWQNELEARIGLELWLETTKQGDRLQLAVDLGRTTVSGDPFTLPIFGGAHECLAHIVFEPVATVKGRALFEATAVLPAHCPAPHPASAWSGALGLFRISMPQRGCVDTSD